VIEEICEHHAEQTLFQTSFINYNVIIRKEFFLFRLKSAWLFMFGRYQKGIQKVSPDNPPWQKW